MASNTGITVTNLLQIISDLRGESSTNSDAARIRAISRAEKDFARRMFWRTHLIKNLTLSGDGTTQDFTIGSATYPMRMKGLDEVFVGGTTEDKRHAIVDFNTYKKLYNLNNRAQIVYEWFDAANDLWKMHINPIPANTSNNITYSYFWEPPTRTLVTDTVICPDPLIIGRLALAYIYEGEDEIQKSLLQKKEVEQMISELEGLENTPAVNQMYQMEAIENAIVPKGMGTY